MGMEDLKLYLLNASSFALASLNWVEAMKMEHSIKASHNGVVSKVLITKDDQVENGAPLMIVDEK